VTQPLDKVRSLQEKLYVAAKASSTRRRRKKKTGLGRYRDYTNKYLYKELGLVCLVSQGPIRYSCR
jgi:hypothetical protein